MLTKARNQVRLTFGDVLLRCGEAATGISQCNKVRCQLKVHKKQTEYVDGVFPSVGVSISNGRPRTHVSRSRSLSARPAEQAQPAPEGPASLNMSRIRKMKEIPAYETRRITPPRIVRPSQQICDGRHMPLPAAGCADASLV